MDSLAEVMRNTSCMFGQTDCERRHVLRPIACFAISASADAALDAFKRAFENGSELLFTDHSLL